MLISKVKKLSRMAQFFYWIEERHAIRVKKNNGLPKPWTDDEILQNHYFTNIRREDDKVTTWFRQNVRDELKESPLVVFATICFRWFNWIPTGEILLEHGYLTKWNCRGVVNGLSKIDGQVFTGAFNISNSGSKKPKIERVCEDYIQPVWDNRDNLLFNLQNPPASLEAAHGFLMEYPGLGGSGFMAAQVVADLKHTAILWSASDWDTWCCPGPGSRRGMNVLLGRDPMGPGLGDDDFRARVNILRPTISDSVGFNLDAQDVQNCLCEYFKYTRALVTGRSKRRYPGAGV